ncbi:hypothetical protein GCM10009854_28850 [Saccharopolyspora halophila]|uniref:HipA-like C-terminal domain-containing protein n=1 Tax=Saccharopolyspora halophila TaxID=405551 RepID=A0ABN3GE63_9PSEU
MFPAWHPVEVKEWDSDETEEQLGTKEKYWVRDPAGTSWLFKYARLRDGVVRGEDWAEWVAHQLGELIGVPTVEVRPALHGDKRGIVSRSLVPSGCRLEHGNELLRRVDPDYDPELSRPNPRYTPEAVRRCLNDVLPPERHDDLSRFTAFDVWCGYLLLDAWIGGRDRHHENWAAVTGGTERWLYLSYDHGNCLGFQEKDSKRRSCVEHPDQLMTWVRKGRSHHFAGQPTLVEIARGALALAEPEARCYWLERLAAVKRIELEALVQRVPASIMSDPARSFCVELLTVNRRRVLDGD